MELGAIGKQFPERAWIEGIVFRDHPGVGIVAGLLKDRLIILWQRIPLVRVGKSQDNRSPLPPSGIVIVGRDLVESKLLVVIRADPFGRIDGALFQRRIDVAACNLLRHRAELLQYPSWKSANAKLQAFQIIDGVDLLPEPATHLTTRVADKHGMHVIFCVELVENLLAAAERVPALIEPLVRSEGDRGPEGEGWILSEIIVGRCMSYFDRAI